MKGVSRNKVITPSAVQHVRKPVSSYLADGAVILSNSLLMVDNVDLVNQFL